MEVAGEPVFFTVPVAWRLDPRESTSLRCDGFLYFCSKRRWKDADWVDDRKQALVLFLKKLTWTYGKPLLVKSPPHTCRIKSRCQEP
jgi:hypothetical protein